MDLPQIRKLKPKLKQFLKRFDDCFPRKDSRAHLPVYVSGQLSDIPEKSAEPIAINAGVPPRTLQEFLSQHSWDHDGARDRLQHIVRDEHAGPNAIGIFDETSDVKKGDKTPGVQRQWCGAVGKKENCRSRSKIMFPKPCSLPIMNPWQNPQRTTVFAGSMNRSRRCSMRRRNVTGLPVRRGHWGAVESPLSRPRLGSLAPRSAVVSPNSTRTPATAMIATGRTRASAAPVVAASA